MSDGQESRWNWVKGALERYETPLIRYAFGLTGSLEIARDVVQDTFIKLCSANRAEVEAHLVRWLYTVCKNRVLDVQKKEKRMAPMEHSKMEEEPCPRPTPSAVVEQRQEASHVLSLVESLPERQREVIRLKFQDGLSYKEISEITGLSVSNVGVQIHMAIKAIRQHLHQEGGSHHES